MFPDNPPHPPSPAHKEQPPLPDQLPSPQYNAAIPEYRPEYGFVGLVGDSRFGQASQPPNYEESPQQPTFQGDGRWQHSTDAPIHEVSPVDVCNSHEVSPIWLPANDHRLFCSRKKRKDAIKSRVHAGPLAMGWRPGPPGCTVMLW